MNFIEKYPFLKEYVEQVGSFAWLGGNKGTVYSFLDDFEEIPEKKIRNAKKSIGTHLDSDEKLLLLFDDTLFGSATDGIIFTDCKIHSKGLWEDPVVIPYEEIESISVTRKDGKMTLQCKNRTVVIGAAGVTNFMLLSALSNFILSAAFLIRNEQQGGMLELKQAEDLSLETAWYNTSFEGEPSQLDKFFDKHEDTIRGVVEKLGIDELVYKLSNGDDETWGMLIDKIYEFMPAPFRLAVSRETLRKIILGNKDKILSFFK